jgi:hypothetical protein
MWAVSQIMQFVYVNRARESAAGLAMTFAGQAANHNRKEVSHITSGVLCVLTHLLEVSVEVGGTSSLSSELSSASCAPLNASRAIAARPEVARAKLQAAVPCAWSTTIHCSVITA